MEEETGIVKPEVADDEEAKILSQTVTALDAFLAEDDRRADQVLAVFARRLDAGSTTETWQQILDSLGRYMGKPLAGLVMWALEPEASDRLERIEHVGSMRVIPVLRAIAGIYGTDLERAFDRWAQNPDDWQLFSRDVFFNQIAQQHVVRVKILKYSGQELLLEGRPNSLLGLANAFVVTLKLIGAADAFSKEKVDNFLKNVEELRKILVPDAKEHGDTVPPERAEQAMEA
jgi:hypothetical protein